MLNLLSEKIEISDIMFENAVKLENFAVEFRYPNEIVEPSDEEIEHFFKIVSNIRSYVIEALSKAD